MARFISDAQLARFSHAHHALANRAHRAVTHMREQKENIKDLVECVGGAAGVGYLRGKMESADGSWTVPGTDLDVELVGGAAGAVVSVFMPHLAGKYSDDLLEVSKGVLSHYFGQVGRKYAKTGKFSLVAGGEADLIGGMSSLSDALST